uniref:hypothetical protein n=1 Tax=Actinomyces bouchesdurhonensis TaxID=1852361 RepID=UPI003C75BC7F
ASILSNKKTDTQTIKHALLWFLRNVARNSPARISNVEIAPLELQRFGVLHKVRVSELRASFG